MLRAAYTGDAVRVEALIGILQVLSNQRGNCVQSQCRHPLVV
jgi:hypothetical protein